MPSPRSPILASDVQQTRPPLASWYAQGTADGFGDRLLMFDNTATGPLELLRVRSEFALVPGFEAALRARFEELASFIRPGFAQARVVNHLENGEGLSVVSTHVAGTRLSELFHSARRVPGLHPASVQLAFNDLLASVADLHRQGSHIAHGALGADRIILTADRRLVVTDYVFGSALQRLHLSQERLWNEFGLVPDPATASGQLDQRADVVQLGLLMLSLVLGRRISPAEYPEQMTPLLQSFAAASDRRAPSATTPLTSWLEQALDPAGFQWAGDAQVALALPPAPRQSVSFRSGLEEPRAEPAAVPDSAAIHEPAVSGPVPVEAPAAPAPVEAVPQPVAFAPVVSEPVAFEAVVPEPVVPESVAFEAVVPEPVVPESVAFESMVPEPLVPEHSAAEQAERSRAAVEGVGGVPLGSTPSVTVEPTVALTASEPVVESVVESVVEPVVEPVEIAGVADEASDADPLPDFLAGIDAVLERARVAKIQTPVPEEKAADLLLRPMKPAAQVEGQAPLSTLLKPQSDEQTTPPAQKLQPNIVRSDAAPLPDRESARPLDPPRHQPERNAPPFLVLPDAAALDDGDEDAQDQRRNAEPALSGILGLGRPEPQKTREPQRYMVVGDPAHASPDTDLDLARARFIQENARRAQERQSGVVPAPLPTYVPSAEGDAAPPERPLLRWVAAALALLVLAQGVIIARLATRGTTASEESARVTITSARPGDVVLLDGKPIGVTPLDVPIEAATGTLQIVSPPSAPVSQTPPAAPTPAAPATEPSAAVAAPSGAGRSRTGSIRVDSPIPLQVMAGSEVLGSTDSGPVSIEPGTRVLDFVNHSLGFRSQQSVRVVAGRVTQVKVTPPNGAINITAQPWAQVWIDGRALGDTPLASVAVPLGEHDIVLRHPQLGERRLKAVVQAGVLARVSASFIP